jgi:predicted lipoprotein with Yx(FWY)xxD motif
MFHTGGNVKTTSKLRTVLRRGAVPIIAAAVLTLAGCGSDSGGSSSDSGGGSGSSGTTVSIRDADGGEVLATPEGLTLYVSDQEKQQVLCKSSECMGIWSPLTVTAGETPTAPASVEPALSTIERPDGSSQVALDGQPLYTFSFDRAAGQVNGDGETDSFDGVDFTWHVARPSGAAPAAPTSPTTSDSSDSSDYGGYSY